MARLTIIREMSIPTTLSCSTVAELSAHVEMYFKNDGRSTVIYRGHGAQSFQLKPKVGRLNPPKASVRTSVNEPLMLELFRRQSPARITITTQSDWELLAIAQHHGMATRLLDWTRNPLAALYFAVSNQCETRNKDGSPCEEAAEIIAWRSTKVDLTQPLPKNPFRISQVVKYVPRITTPRLRVQSGLFTVHPQPSSEFNPPGITRIRIPFLRRKELKDSLFRHGINESVLFPDLDALARHIEWCQIESY